VIVACLRALAERAPQVTPIVIDNASADRTLDRLRAFPSVRVIANQENRGFAGAVNQGLQASDADYALLLNPDVKLLTAIDPLVEASEKYGLSAGKLVDQNGRAQKGFTIRRFPTPAALAFELLGLNRLWPTNPVNRHYRYLDRDLDLPGPVEQPAGAFLMIRRDVWESLDGFDERFYPIWFEDVDFCNRAVKNGIRIEYMPQVQACHEGGHSVGSLKSGCRTLYWCASLLRYAAKYFSLWEYRGICLTIILGSLPRSGWSMIRERSFAPATTWVEVVKLAVRHYVTPDGISVSPKQS
jgi:N-acetylglucosaminyl-diphospho-decaprenol L-rhamnosyltransferase